MSMPGEQNPLIDTAIDDAARELTEGRPRAVLRTNVAAQITGHQFSPWRLGWVAGSAVAAVVIVMALLWPTGPNESRIAEPERRTAVLPIAPAPTGEVIPDADTPVGQAVSGSPGEPDRVRPTNGPIAIAAPESVEPIVIEPIELNAMAVDELEVPMLWVETMIPEPLTVQ
jgi:hypothetical protein